MSRICVIGTGRMGSALARAFLNHGYVTHVWNRTPEKVLPLVERGATAAGSVEEAVAAAEVVVVNLIDYGVSDDLLHKAAATRALRGKLLVQLSSGSPRQARAGSEWATSHGIAYLDGAIMATPNFIGEPGATILYAGSRIEFERNAPVFGALGGNAVFLGEDVGHASALDTALLSQLWGTLFGTLHAVAVSEAEGIELDTLATSLQSFKPVIDGAADDLVARVRDGRHLADEQTLASIAAHYGAFQHLLEVSEERGLNRVVSHAFDNLFQSAIARGHLRDDFAALSRVMRRAPAAPQESLQA